MVGSWPIASTLNSHLPSQEGMQRVYTLRAFGGVGDLMVAALVSYSLIVYLHLPWV